MRKNQHTQEHRRFIMDEILRIAMEAPHCVDSAVCEVWQHKKQLFISKFHRRFMSTSCPELHYTWRDGVLSIVVTPSHYVIEMNPIGYRITNLNKPLLE